MLGLQRITINFKRLIVVLPSALIVFRGGGGRVPARQITKGVIVPITPTPLFPYHELRKSLFNNLNIGPLRSTGQSDGLFYSEDLSSKSGEVYHFFCNICV